MSQTKLSKQQKKAIIILGEVHKKYKEGKHPDSFMVSFTLKRKMCDLYAHLDKDIFEKKEYTKDTKRGLLNKELVSTTRSLKRLEERGLISKLEGGYLYPHYFLTEEGKKCYESIKQPKRMF